MYQILPSDYATLTSLWTAVAFGYDPGQPAPTAVAAGMELSWDLDTGSYGNALQGVWIQLVAGRRYTFTITVESSSVPWRGATPYLSSSSAMTGTGRVSWTYTPSTSGGTFVGIQIAAPTTTGTTVVSEMTARDTTGPTARVEISTSPPNAAVQEWVDVTAYVATEVGPITCSRGRSDEWSQVEPGRFACPLDNSDGRFTFGYTAGAYYPGIKPGRRVRHLVTDDGVTWVPRFDGYADGWPSNYAAGDTSRSIVTLTATDRLARLGAMRKLRDPLLEELGTAGFAQADGWILGDPDYSILGSTTVLGSEVSSVYGLQESSGSTTAGDSTGALGRPMLTVQQVGSEGALEFGAAGIMPEGTACQFSPASAGNGVVLTTSSLNVGRGSTLTLFCQFAWSGTAGVTLARVHGVTTADGSYTISATSSTVVATYLPDATVGGAAVVATKTAATNDNRPHFVAVTCSGTTMRLYVDDLTPATAAITLGSRTPSSLTIGGTTSADVHQVAWVGISRSAYTAERIAELSALATGAAERSDARIARILGYLGIASSDLALETGLSDVAYQAMGGQSALDLVKTVNEIEGGVFFPAADGTYVQHSRAHRYNRPATITPAPDEVDVDFAVQVDMTSVVNDLTASRPRGATVHVVDADSVAEYDTRTQGDGIVLYAATDTDLESAANALVRRQAWPQPRAPQVTIDLLTCSDATRWAVLTAQIGDRLQISGLPDATTPGGGTVDLMIEGISDVISPTEWRVTLATSPGGGNAVWELGTSLLGVDTVLAR